MRRQEDGAVFFLVDNGRVKKLFSFFCASIVSNLTSLRKSSPPRGRGDIRYHGHQEQLRLGHGGGDSGVEEEENSQTVFIFCASTAWNLT